MDEQMDGRTLLGSYVCTEKPGEFKWAPGSLTQVCIGEYCSSYNPGVVFFLSPMHINIFHQAIVKGFWIVFEDIDKAPSDVRSILVPLLEGSNTFSVGHAEVRPSF
jgi:midasin